MINKNTWLNMCRQWLYDVTDCICLYQN